jgi:RHS repeat-associated protein
MGTQHHDQQGSTRLLTNLTGTFTGATNWDVYGNVASAVGTQSHLGYAGQYTDTETGFQYLRNRYYDPATGQFTTPDPLRTLTGSPYGYANNSPLNASDPTGLFSIGDAFSSIGHAIGQDRLPSGQLHLQPPHRADDAHDGRRHCGPRPRDRRTTSGRPR